MPDHLCQRPHSNAKPLGCLRCRCSEHRVARRAGVPPFRPQALLAKRRRTPSGRSRLNRGSELEPLLAQLRRDGVTIVKGPESDENGRFAWIVDPDGNKVELWEPIARDEKNKTA